MARCPSRFHRWPWHLCHLPAARRLLGVWPCSLLACLPPPVPSPEAQLAGLSHPAPHHSHEGPVPGLRWPGGGGLAELGPRSLRTTEGRGGSWGACRQNRSTWATRSPLAGHVGERPGMAADPVSLGTWVRSPCSLRQPSTCHRTNGFSLLGKGCK